MGLGFHTSTKLPSEANADSPETLNLPLLGNFLLESAQRGGDALSGGAVKGQAGTHSAGFPTTCSIHVCPLGSGVFSVA